MDIIESKNVDLLISTDNVLDLYDEQIDSNKDISLDNKQKLDSLLGRMSTVESFSNNFETRISTLETHSSEVKASDIAKLNSDVLKILEKQKENTNKINVISSDVDDCKTKVITNKNLIDTLSTKTNNDTTELKTGLLDVKNSISTTTTEFNTFKQEQTLDNLQKSTELSNVNSSITVLNRNTTDLKTGFDTISAKVLALQNQVNNGAVGNVSVIAQKVNDIKSDFDAFKTSTNNNILSITNQHNTDISNIQNSFNNVYTKQNIDDTFYKKTGGEINGIITLKGDGSFIQGETKSHSEAWRIKCFSLPNDDSYLEISTADDGNEGIAVRQYKNNIGSGLDGFDIITNEAWILDKNGNTSFPKVVSAKEFNGVATKLKYVRSSNNEKIKFDTPFDTNTYFEGASFYGVYKDYNTENSPADYGNVLYLNGLGQSQLFCEWRNIDLDGYDNPRLFYRSRNDRGNSRWTKWTTIANVNDIKNMNFLKGDTSIGRGNDNYNDIDWDNAVERSAYGAWNFTRNDAQKHSPNSYSHGILGVFSSFDTKDNASRVAQIYFPHQREARLQWRVAIGVPNPQGAFISWQEVPCMNDIKNIQIQRNVLVRNHTYSIGDIAYSPNFPSWARLECVASGTTHPTIELTFGSNDKVGRIISDGTCKWIIDDIRDSTPVFSVRGSLYVPDGYVVADGRTVNRADYPRLVNLADKYGLWTNDTNGWKGLLGRGDGSTTMVLPNFINRMIQYSDVQHANVSGKTIDAGLPNITGEIESIDGNDGILFRTVRVNNTNGGRNVGNGNNVMHSFDASRSNPIYGASNTVQPPSITMFPILKY